MHREPNDEHGPPGLVRTGSQMAVMRLDDRSTDAEAHSKPPLSLGNERLKQLLGIDRSEAWTVVAHLNL